MRREDYLSEDLLPRPANWHGENRPDFMECPNDPDKVFVLSSGGYILFDKREEDRGGAMKDWIANHTVLSEGMRGIIVLNGIARARFEELKREIEAALRNKSFEDGWLILHDVPEVLYIPVGGANDQASS